MNAQKQLLKAGGSVLALAGLLSKVRAKFNDEGHIKAKQNYSKTATVKKQNTDLAKKQIEAIEQKEIAKEEKKPISSFGELVSAADIKGKENTTTFSWDEHFKEVPEENAAIKGFGEIVSAENSETKIPATDPDVQGLIEVKEKNLKRAAAGKNNADKQEKLLSLYAKKHKGNYDRNALNKFLDEFGFNKSAADYKSVGLDKHYLNSNAIVKAEEQGEGMPGFINTMFNGMIEKYKSNKDAVEYLELQKDMFQNKHGNISWGVDNEDDASDSVISDFDWQQLVIDTDELVDNLRSGKYKEFIENYKGTKDDSEPENWYDNFTRETNTYKVWDDTAEELPETDRSFSGIVF